MVNDFDLGPPFAFVGCVGVLAAAMLWCAGVPAHYVVPWLLLPVALYFIGRWQSRTGNYAATFGLVGLVSWSLGTFLLAPVTVRGGICGSPLEYVLVGMVMGVAAYLPLVIPLGIFMVAAKRVREARPGSLAARAEHRFIWAAGILPFTWLAGGAIFTVILVGSATWEWSLLLAVAIGAQLAPLLADARALRRIARYAPSPTRCQRYLRRSLTSRASISVAVTRSAAASRAQARTDKPPKPAWCSSVIPNAPPTRCAPACATTRAACGRSTPSRASSPSACCSRTRCTSDRSVLALSRRRARLRDRVLRLIAAPARRRDPPIRVAAGQRARRHL